MPSSPKQTASESGALAGISFHDPIVAHANLEHLSVKLSPALREALPALLSDAPDPDSALLLLDRMATESPETIRVLEAHPFLAHYAIAVFGNSRYLGETLVKNPDILQSFLRERKLDRSFSHEEFSEALARFQSRSFDRDTSLLLARFKRREYVRIMLRDVLKISPLAETTAEISILSDVLIAEALREAESAMERRFGLPQHLDSEGRAVNTPFAVLSLGKLGGNELNYSSDIDLLYLYGDGKEPPSASMSNREYFVRLGQLLTESLSRSTAEGAVFRIDLRLRPQGNEGELAISLSNALRYYAEAAHDWERQALIKVRHSAGNVALAREFIRRVQPQVYSEKINFAAIKTALVAREKIDKKRRRQIAAEGHESINVKVDRGGIRDIEFLVQCLQRVYGGAESWLRSGGTLFSLHKLHDKRHISGHDFHELTSAYTFLRHLEHRLQLRQGQQVHRLPSSPTELQALQRSMTGLTPGYQLVDLVSAIRERMAAVSEIYRRVIYQQEPGRNDRPQQDGFELRSRHEGAFADASHSQLLERIAEDAPNILRVLNQSDLSSAGKRNLLRFLSAAYGSSRFYTSLLRNEQNLLRSLPVFENSEYLTEALVRNPEELQTLAEIHGNESSSSAESLFEINAFIGEQFESGDRVFDYVANSTASLGERTALLRQHFRHRMFASGARDIAEHRSIYASFAETTSAADAALRTALALASVPKGLAIFALGRLGTREFDLLSDADLLFVCDEGEDKLAFAKSVERLIQALAAYTNEGLVFPVDTRLRPRGAEGELLVTPAQLQAYFASEAQPWEALTFTKLRPISGGMELSRKTVAVSEFLFSRFAAEHDFAVSVQAMRQKLQDASAPEKSIRTSEGALYDIDFLSSFLLVKHAITPKTGNLRDRIWRCASAGALDSKDAALLDHAAELFRTVEHAMRLVTGRNSRWLPAADHPRQAIQTLTSKILRSEVEQGLEEELLRAFAEVRAIYDRVVQ